MKIYRTSIILAIILIILVIFNIDSVNKNQSSSSDFESYVYNFENSKESVAIIYDNKTGCQYFSGANNEKILIINADGSPYITKKDENFKSRFKFINNADCSYIIDKETGCQYLANNWGDPYCYRYDSNGNVYVEK